jgi:hypothetical protein
MTHRKRIRALGRTSVVVSIAIARSVCSASKYPAPTAQFPNSATRTAAPDSGAALPEVGITAPCLRSPSVAEESSSRPPAKRGC